MPTEPEEFRLKPKRRWKIALLLPLLLLPVAPLAIRAWRMALVADVPDPFDVAAAGYVVVDPAKNAFDYYRQASNLLVPTGRLQNPDQNRAALQLFRAGSELPEAVYHQPAQMTVSTLLDVTQNLRQLSREAAAEASKLEEAGDPKGAWEWHRACLRASRHTGMHGCLIERLVGVAIHAAASENIAAWAAKPGNDAAALRSALAEIRSIYRMTVPPSGPLKIEYQFMTKRLDDPQQLFGGDRSAGLAMQVSGFLGGEPAVSRSALKLVFDNYLSQCDKPRPKRTAVAPGAAGLFELDPSDTTAPARLSPAEIERILQHAPFAQLVLPAVAQTVIAHDREQARQGLLEMALGLQIWHREHGSFPDAAEKLVGKGFDKLPLDPFGRGEPLRYRVEPNPADGVVIWSIGPDGKGDGQIDPSGEGDKAQLEVQVKPPPT